MRLETAYISGWRYNGGVAMEFNDCTRAVIVDRTGVGSSAFLEAIALIFRNLSAASDAI